MPHTLLIECSDRTGLVYTITGVLARDGYNVLTNHEFVDREHGRFFMRTEFSGAADPADLAAELRRLLPDDAAVRLAAAAPRPIVVLVTKEHHCLGDLLVRHSFGEFGATIRAVIGNRATLGPLVERFDVPFHFVDSDGLTRESHEAAMVALIDRYAPETIVLAKYMRVLTPAFVARYHHRIINIHHSFLPAFIGANPYRQAYERGVKIIGATAHFVTDSLDEGPIIGQSIIPVTHSHSAQEMAQAGRDVEKVVLARALKLVFEERVFIAGNRTVIFD